MELDQRPLAESLVDRPAQRAPHGVAHGVVVAPRPRRELAERALDSVAQNRCGSRCRRRLDQPDYGDSGWRYEASLAVENQGGHGAAVENEAPPLLERSAAERQEALAVAGQPADRHLVDDGGTARRQPDHVAVLDDQRLLDLALLGEMGVGDQMASFAMNWDRHQGADHLVHAHELVARGMAGDVDEMVLLGDDLDPEPNQRVLQS